ncbi:MAG: hypothetical protein HYS05_05830 [Acidobacteria bacterium]|nr:hypothetical protein [Acidobacteriota bacterium]
MGDQVYLVGGLPSARAQSPSTACDASRHENGIVEQAHFRTKTAVEQALLLRGHADFVDQATHETFVREVIEGKRNAPAACRLAEKRPSLRPLPAAPVPNYCVVSSSLAQLPRSAARFPQGRWVSPLFSTRRSRIS